MAEDPRTAPLVKAVREGMRSSLVGIGANLALAVFKCAAGFLGHSFALVADGVESFSDVVSSTVVFFGLKFAIKPPDEDHPYGHGKAEPVASIIVSLALIAAAVFIGVESIRRIQEPHPLPELYTLWVLLAVVGIKIVLSRYVTAIGRHLESSAVDSDAWHHLSDAITSGFAFIGISIALLIRNPAADDWAALCASPVIIFNAYRKVRHPFAELLDAKPSPEIERKIRSIASKVPGVVGVEKCQVRKVGFSYYVNLHIIVHGEISVIQGHSIAHKVEDTILKEAPRVAEALIHVEPDEADQLAKLNLI
jgi:cation diffusion facilitator family transporter